jgi:hypothetical protein
MTRGVTWPVGDPAYATRMPTPAAAARARIPWGFAELFVLSQTALPALLYLPGTQPLRLPIRMSAFIISLVALGWWLLYPARHRQPHAAYGWVAAVFGLLVLMLFHPTTGSLYGGLAHIMVYVAVIAPFFWAPAFVSSPDHLARLLGLILICSGINSLVGVLQVYAPGTFMPTELSRMITDSSVGLGPVTYAGPDGRLIVRPPGLFDTPGAVAGPAMFATLLGAVFGLSALPRWIRLGSFGFSAAGIAAVYLTHVRVSFVMALLMFIAYAFALIAQRRVAKATTVATIGASVGLIGFAIALALGGASVSERFLTLLASDPVEVYYGARGIQLSYSLSELLYDYPLGAGLARWGMAAAYFGSGMPTMWAELQVTGWLIDGGVPMLLLYSGALFVVARSQYRIVRLTQYPKVAACAAVVFALSMGPIAMVLSFTPFVTQIGVQFWFLAGALHGVAATAGLHDA